MNYTFALVGNPNSGKSTLFNLLTGRKQKVANYPGATVESSIGKINENISLIDLPGLYGLKAQGLDEIISRDYIIQNSSNKHLQKFSKDQLHYHKLVIVADSTRLEKSLYLCLELKRLKIPFILVLNRFDLADKRKQEINIDLLKEKLETNVLQTSRFSLNSISELKNELIASTKSEVKPQEHIPIEKINHLISIDNWSTDTFKEIDQLLNLVTIKKIKPDDFSDKIDHILLNPWFGPLICLILFYLIFQTLFEFSGPFQDIIANTFDYFSSVITSMHLHPILQSFLVDGLINGIGGSVIFVPQITFLFLFIGIMEESAYLSRVAYLLDSFMIKLGLPGKATIPLLSSHACAIPGIMSTRTLGNDRDRIVTMLISPLTACSARLPVYALLLACFLPKSFQGLALFSLYLLGIISSLIIAYIMKFIKPVENKQSHIIELPDYQWPNMKMVIKNTFSKATMFLKKAGTVILFLTIGLWFLTYFPLRENQGIEHSYAGKIANVVQPIFAPLGFDHKLTVALIPSFAAREVMVSTMATVMSVDDPDTDVGIKDLQEKIQAQYPLGTLLALIIWFVYAPQCISTFAVMRRETHGWKWPAITFGYTLTLAYILAFVTKIMI